MKEKFIEWVCFHGEILERYKFPYVVWSVGVVVMFGVQCFYPKIINAIYEFQLLGQFPFRQIIEINIDYLKHGMWLIPMLVLGFFIVFGIQIHQKNIKRIYRY